MTISVQSSRASSTIYAVDASNATVRKNNATSTVSAIAVGDRVLVRGTVNGTSVTAASIIDGNFGRGFAGNGNPFNASSSANGMPFGRGRGGRPFGAVSGTMPFVSGTFPFASGTSPFASGTPPFGRFGGLGGESITGTVASVGNSTLTVTGNNGTTYTVDISSATLVKQGNATSSVSAINVGDSVQIQGNVSGTSVTANIIVDNVSQSSSNRGFFGTIEGAIGNLFSKLFHFNFRF